jgi:hypothetical protein
MTSASKLLGGAAGTSAAGGGLTVDQVFSTDLWTGNGGTQAIDNGIDLSGEGGMVWIKRRDSGNDHYLNDTVRGAAKILLSNDTAQQLNWNANDTFKSFDSSGFTVGANSGFNGSGEEIVSWTFRKAPKFFDVVQFTGTGSARTIAHSLGSVPGMIVIKQTNTSRDWIVYHVSRGTAKHLGLNRVNGEGPDTSGEYWNSTTPTSSHFSLGSYFGLNQNGGTYIAYIFATLANVSKVGSATHSGTTNVDAGFTNGSRFVLLKRTDAYGDWYVWDSVRGIVSGNDPYLALNSAAAQVTNTDYIDPYSAGFTLTSSLTAGTYIYYAIA